MESGVNQIDTYEVNFRRIVLYSSIIHLILASEFIMISEIMGGLRQKLRIGNNQTKLFLGPCIRKLSLVPVVG